MIVSPHRVTWWRGGEGRDVRLGTGGLLVDGAQGSKSRGRRI